MPNTAKKAAKKAATGTRKTFTEETKEKAVAFAIAKGYGGNAKAAKEFDTTVATIGAWVKAAKKKAAEDAEAGGTPANGAKVDLEKVWSVLGGKGFKISQVTTYGATGPETKFEGDPKLKAVNFVEPIGAFHPDTVADGETVVISTAKKTVVALTLEHLLSICGIKPSA